MASGSHGPARGGLVFRVEQYQPSRNRWLCRRSRCLAAGQAYRGPPDETAAEELFASPDSPFGDPAFDPLRQAIPKLFAGVKELSRLPLSFCEGPNAGYNASGPLRELYCVYQFGPFRQYLVLRLQQADGRWYYTEVRAMNERRFRQLLAIANSFHATI
jgi:hypothetical protein